MIKTHMYTYDYVSECLLRSPCVQGDVGSSEVLLRVSVYTPRGISYAQAKSYIRPRIVDKY
jgi:hypothetical protein